MDAGQIKIAAAPAKAGADYGLQYQLTLAVIDMRASVLNQKFTII
jgi:hypothetical protein